MESGLIQFTRTFDPQQPLNSKARRPYKALCASRFGDECKVSTSKSRSGRG